MKKQTIYAVGIDLPGDAFEYVPFHSHSTLLDADLVIYAPSLDAEVDAARNRESLAFWKEELSGALADGKTVIVLLNAPQTLPAGDGDLDSYAALPFAFRSLRRRAGERVTLAAGPAGFTDYWREFEGISRCDTLFTVDGAMPLLTAGSEGLLAAAVLPRGEGRLILLPALGLDHETFTYCDTPRHEYFWTEEALAYGQRLLRQVVVLDRVYTHATAAGVGLSTELPAWIQEERFRLPIEVTTQAEIAAGRAEIAGLQEQIAVLQQQINRLQEGIAEREARLPAFQRYTGLLCASGTILQHAVEEAMRLCGFSVESGNGELVCRQEGLRCLCQVAGSPDGAIELEQVLQLEQRIQDDFARDNVNAYARGVLLVNPYCTLPPEERPQLFSDKALAAAQRSGFALIHTPDLFRVVQSLEGASSEAYAAQVRAVIGTAAASPLAFPEPPAGV